MWMHALSTASQRVVQLVQVCSKSLYSSYKLRCKLVCTSYKLYTGIINHVCSVFGITCEFATAVYSPTGHNSYSLSISINNITSSCHESCAVHLV